MFDVIIKNGTIIDGAGTLMFKADIGIRDGEIKRIGELHNEKAEAVIDAYGHLVCPGFIDVNNHSDTYWQIFSNPDLESLIYQGITTIIGGNCGSSLAPLFGAKAIDTIQKWTDLKNITLNWLELEEFLDVLEKRNLSVNFATLVGHANLRRGILKDEMRSLSPKELKFIYKKLEKCLKSGALGLSTGLVYAHAKLATAEELTELAKIIAKKGGVYVTHLRGEREELLESLEEAVKIAQNTKVKLHISHLKAVGENNWNRMEGALAMIEHVKKMGVDVTFDVFPYTSTGSVLYTLLPDWVTEGGKKIMIHRLRDQAIRAKVIAEMKKNGFDYSKVEIAISPLNKTLARKKITEIAASQEKSIEEAIIDVLIASDGRVITSMEVLSKENVEKAIAHECSFVSTNGSGYKMEHKASGEVVHPRCFGTFIKLFADYVVGRRILSWEEAIRKITGAPAEKFGIAKRGILKEGYFADIVVLNQDNLESPANKENPYQYPKGVEYVLVNGEITLEKGKYNGRRFGRIIRK